MNHLRLVAVALATTSIAASGCGGSSKTSSGTASTPTGSSTSHTESSPTEPSTQTGPLTRAELIAQADTICRRLNQKRLSTTVGARQTYADVLTPVAAYDQAAAAQMRKLTPPASIAKDWNQIVSGTQAIADAMTATVAYAKAGKLKEAEPLSIKLERATQQILSAAKRAGFKDCARRSA